MRHVTHCDFGWLSPSSQLSPIHIYFPRLSCLIKFPYLHLKIFVLQGSPRIFQILSFCYATGQHNKSCVVCLLPVSLIHKFLKRVFSKFSPELGESSVSTSGQPPSLITPRVADHAIIQGSHKNVGSICRSPGITLLTCGDSRIRNASDARHRCLLGARETAGIAFAL